MHPSGERYIRLEQHGLPRFAKLDQLIKVSKQFVRVIVQFIQTIYGESDKNITKEIGIVIGASAFCLLN